MFSEELDGEGGVCDDRAALLLDGLADDAGAFDVSCLAFAYAEDVGYALDSVHEARSAVCGLAAAAEGFLYGLVDDLLELCYGEVDDSSVLVHFYCIVCLAPGGGLEPPCLRIAVCLISLALGCSCSFPGWEGLVRPLCFVFEYGPRLTALD